MTILFRLQPMLRIGVVYPVQLLLRPFHGEEIKPDQLRDAVVIYGDSTIALPLIAAYAWQSPPSSASRAIQQAREHAQKTQRGIYKR